MLVRLGFVFWVDDNFDVADVNILEVTFRFQNNLAFGFNFFSDLTVHFQRFVFSLIKRLCILLKTKYHEINLLTLALGSLSSCVLANVLLSNFVHNKVFHTHKNNKKRCASLCIFVQVQRRLLIQILTNQIDRRDYNLTGLLTSCSGIITMYIYKSQWKLMYVLTWLRHIGSKLNCWASAVFTSGTIENCISVPSFLEDSVCNILLWHKILFRHQNWQRRSSIQVATNPFWWQEHHNPPKSEVQWFESQFSSHLANAIGDSDPSELCTYCKLPP